MSNEVVQAPTPAQASPTPSAPAASPSRPRGGAGGSGEGGLEAAPQGGSLVREAPREEEGGQTGRRPEPRQVRRADGVPSIVGESRTTEDVRATADDLLARLRTRREGIEEEIAERETTEERKAQLRAQLPLLDLDMRQLRAGGNDRHDRAAVEDMARRYGIEPTSLARGSQTSGQTTTVTRGMSQSGLGVTETRTHEDATADPDSERTGARTARTTSSSRTTALDSSGLSSSRSETRSSERADGSGRSRTTSASTRVGVTERGLGVGRTTGGSTTETRAPRRPGEGNPSVTRANETSTAVGVNSTGVSAGRSRSDTTTWRRQDGSSTELRSTRGTTGGVTTNDEGEVTGATATHSRSTRRTERDASGEETRQTSSGGSVTGGLTRDDQGRLSGGSLGGTHQSSEATRDGASSRSVGGTATVTRDSVGATGTASGAIERGPVRVGANVGAGGSYSITATPVPDTEPLQYELVTTFTYNVTIGGTVGTASDTLGAQSTVSASVGGSYTRSRTQTFRSRLTLEEMRQYMRGAERAAASGEHNGSDAPEIGMMARYRAAQAQGRTPSEEEMRDPRTAARLREGQSVEHAETTTRSGQISGQVSGGGVGFGASHSRSREETVSRRERRTTYRGRPIIEITLTFSRQDEQSTSGNASVDGVGGHYGESTSQRRGRIVVVRLAPPPDPQYDRNYREAMSVSSQTEAETLAQRTGSTITRSESRTETRSGGMGVMNGAELNTGLSASDSRTRGSELTVGTREDGTRSVSGTTTGGSTSRAGLNVAGTQVLSGTVATQATSEVTQDGTARAEVSQTRSGGLELPAVLQRLWRTTETNLQRYDLSEADLQALTARAGNARGWQNALNARELLHIPNEWRAFGQRLVHPNPQPEWLEANPEMAFKIARGQALTEFVASVGADYGMAAMHAILRGSNPSQPLGVRWDWPDALRAQQRQYQSLRTEVRGAAERFRRMPEANRAANIQREADRIVNALNGIKTAIEGCREFEDVSVRVEMLDAIDRDIRTVRAAQQEASSRPASAPGQAATSPAATGQAGQGAQPGRPAQAEGPQVGDPTGPGQQEADGRRRLEEELAQKTTTAQRFKAEENTHWRTAQRHIATGRDRIFTSSFDDAIAAETELDKISRDWVGLWGAAWRRMVELHQQLGRGAADRAKRTNTDWRIQLYREALTINNFAGYGNPEGKIARWRREDAANP